MTFLFPWIKINSFLFIFLLINFYNLLPSIEKPISHAPTRSIFLIITRTQIESEASHDQSISIRERIRLIICSHRNSDWAKCLPCRFAAGDGRFFRHYSRSWRRGRCSYPPRGLGYQLCGTMRGNAALERTMVGVWVLWLECRLWGCLKEKNHCRMVEIVTTKY